MKVIDKNKRKRGVHKVNRKILLIIFSLFSIFLLTGCNNDNKEIHEELLNINYDIENNETTLEKYDTTNPVVALYIKNYGSIVIELYKDKAPNTVNNFIELVKNGFYDNNTMHRLVPGFVLQGGDPTGTGIGGPGYTIKGEFSSNGYENDLKHDKYIVSMARSGEPDSAGSQFFIMLDKSSDLDGKYAAFGKVIDGFSILDKIVENEIVIDPESGKLLQNLTIKKALIDLKSHNLEEVEKIEE